MSERISAEIDNNIAEIACITALVERFGLRHGLPETVIFAVKLAFDELLTNTISYGFLDGRRHRITALIGLEEDGLEAEIIDDGIAFDPLAVPAPEFSVSIEERKIGGLGIHLVRSLMDQVSYRRLDGRNHFKMVKKVPAEPVE